MLVKTKHFGEINFPEDKVITFEEGIPGFPDSKQYILLLNEDEENNPFSWLQSINEEEVTFPIINPFLIFPEYTPQIKEETIELLGEPKIEKLAVYTIVTVPSDLTKMSVNLQAPIVIQVETKKGMQVFIDNSEYQLRHYIYGQFTKQLDEKAGE